MPEIKRPPRNRHACQRVSAPDKPFGFLAAMDALLISSVCVYKHTARCASAEHMLSLPCSKQFAVLSAAVPRRSRGAPVRWRHARDRAAAPPTQLARAPARRGRLPRACRPTSAGAGDLRGARTNRKAQSPNGRRESGAASCGRRLRSRCRRAGHAPAAPEREGGADPEKTQTGGSVIISQSAAKDGARRPQRARGAGAAAQRGGRDGEHAGGGEGGPRRRSLPRRGGRAPALPARRRRAERAEGGTVRGVRSGVCLCAFDSSLPNQNKRKARG